MGRKGQYVYDALLEYSEGDFYPFHMPGHKRRKGTMGGISDPCRIDITEIEGFDNLHKPASLLLEAQERAAELYGSEESYFLVNGSTAGILSAVGACAHTAYAGGNSRPGKLLMARNCHRSVYHAVYLNGLEPVYLYPEPLDVKDGDCAAAVSVNGRIRPEDVERALEGRNDICAVMITSPTYDGVISDVRGIARAAHRHRIPLIVDEAHGAHFGFHPDFPENSVRLGADLVIHSLHKTLPSLTQTALLHRNGMLTDAGMLRRMLGIYQTSSPSYVLMASIDQCIRRMAEKGTEDLEQLSGMLRRFYQVTEDLTTLGLIRTDDPSRILITDRSGGLSGQEICAILRERYHLELEMAAPSYALALTASGDDEEGLVRLAQALQEMDRELFLQQKFPGRVLPEWLASSSGNGQDTDRPGTGAEKEGAFLSAVQLHPRIRIPLAKAWDMAAGAVLLEHCEGLVSAEFVYLYPPGVPLLTPGEIIDSEMIRHLVRLREKGYLFMGCRDENLESLSAVLQPENI